MEGIVQAAALLGAGIAAIGGIGAGLGQGIATGYAVVNRDLRIGNLIPFNILKRIIVY